LSKSKLTLKIDEEIKETAKQKYNVSQTVEEHLRNLVARPDSKEDRLEEINEEIKEHKDAISSRQKKISDLQSEKQVLEKELNQEAKAENQKVKFFRIAKRNIGDSWKSPDDIPDYWRSRFEESVDELWKLAKNSEAEPAERKKVDSSSASVNTV